MQKDEILVLIVEDDKNLGKALSEVVVRLGYKVMHVTKPDEALAILKIQVIHFALIDCMLPIMNGRDLAVQFRKDTSDDLPIALMSGIYKDKGFIKDAMQTTGACAFLTKPFHVDELAKVLEKNLAAQIPQEESVIPIYELMRKRQMTLKERINAINETDSVHGFDLPWVYSLLMDPAVSGHLNLISADGEVAGVGFSKGQIVQVNLADSESYFGNLLVENGFLTTVELNEVLKTHSKAKIRRIGEFLIDANFLSPHAVETVVAEQLAIRLSKTIADTSLKVNFVRAPDIRIEASINRTEFTRFTDDWISSKIKIEWLKALYVPWMNSTMVPGPEYSDTHRCLTLPVLSRIPKLATDLVSGRTLEEVIGAYEGEEQVIYQGLHVLLLARQVIFDQTVVATDFEPQRKRLRRLNTALEKQNFFERLGLSQKSKDAEIKRTYLEFAKVLHPDKLANDVPKDIRDLTIKAFEKISEAYETLSNSSAKEAYLKELLHGNAELHLQAEGLVDQGKALLSKGDVKKASEILTQASKLAPPTSDLKLLLIWTQLKTPGVDSNTDKLTKIRDQMGSIPPEERHTELYYFVRGLLFLANSDFTNAQKNVEHAVSINPDFIEARRELNVIKVQSKANKPVDLFRGDLKDVVGMLFKKKK